MGLVSLSEGKIRTRKDDHVRHGRKWPAASLLATPPAGARVIRGPLPLMRLMTLGLGRVSNTASSDMLSKACKFSKILQTLNMF